MFRFYFGSLSDEQQINIEVALQSLINSIFEIGRNIKLMSNGKVAEKYELLSKATLSFVEIVYSYRIEDVKILAHELKKAISNFGYHAVKVDKRAANKINNRRFKRNIDMIVEYLEQIIIPKEEMVLE